MERWNKQKGTSNQCLFAFLKDVEQAVIAVF